MPQEVLITGGTGGLGTALGRLLGSMGLTPIIGHRAGRKTQAEKLALDCGGVPLLLEMTDPDVLDQAINQLIQRPNPLAGVVLAASPPPHMVPFGQMTDQDLQHYFQANVIGPHRLLAGVVKKCLRPQKKGTVVAVLSQAMGSHDRRAMGTMGAYTISKYGLLGLIKQLEADFTWLRVASVSPGFTETPMLQAFDPRFLEAQRLQAPFASAEQVAREIAAFFHEKTTHSK